MHSRSLGHNLLMETNRVGLMESHSFPFSLKLKGYELTGGSEGASGFDVTCRGCACVPSHVWADGCPADVWSLQTCVWVSEAHVLKKHAWRMNPKVLSKSSK